MTTPKIKNLVSVFNMHNSAKIVILWFGVLKRLIILFFTPLPPPSRSLSAINLLRFFLLAVALSLC